MLVACRSTKAVTVHTNTNLGIWLSVDVCRATCDVLIVDLIYDSPCTYGCHRMNLAAKLQCDREDCVIYMAW